MANARCKRKRDDIPSKPLTAKASLGTGIHLGEKFPNIISLIQRCRRVVVLAGAGISVSCGVPDFRSENGIYSMAKDLHHCAALPDPQAIFDIEYFRDDPRPFYQLAKKILFKDRTSETCASRQPSPTHRFIAALETSGRLLRCYTQNIDGLEAAAGVSSTRLRCPSQTTHAELAGLTKLNLTEFLVDMPDHIRTADIVMARSRRHVAHGNDARPSSLVPSWKTYWLTRRLRFVPDAAVA